MTSAEQEDLQAVNNENANTAASASANEATSSEAQQNTDQEGNNNVRSSPDPTKSATGSLQATGIKAVLEKSLQSYDKLPMLEIIFEKFVRQLSTALRNLTSEVVDVSILEFNSLRFSNYFSSLKNPFCITVFRAIEWENFGLIILENRLINSFVDLLLGGKKHTTQPGEQSEERALTSIEQGIARQIAETILNELSQSFDQISPTTFNFERLESNPNFVTISRPGDAVMVLKLNIEIDQQAKTVDIMIPYKTIEPIKEQMQQVFLGDKFGNDHEWERMIVSSINDVLLKIEAVITNKISTVKEIVNLKIGDTIVMNHSKDKDITVRSGPIELFTGKVGKVDNKVAINLKKTIG